MPFDTDDGRTAARGTIKPSCRRLTSATFGLDQAPLLSTIAVSPRHLAAHSGLARYVGDNGCRRFHAACPDEICLTVEDGTAIAAVLDLAEKGIDFADALHISRSVHGEGFATYGRRLAKAAKTAGYRGVQEA